MVKLGIASLLSTVKRAKRRYSAGFLKSGSIRFSGLLAGQKIKGLRFFEIVEEMLSLEGKESMRLEMERMKEEMTTNFGFSVEIGAPYGGPRQSPPVQLELLPMRSSTHESETNALAAPGSDSVTKPFSWAQQQPVLSRMNSSSGYDQDGVMETYSSGGRGASPRDIDMNQLPSTSDCDEAVLSSPSSIGMKRERKKLNLLDPAHEQDRGWDLSSRGGSDDEDGSGNTRKKLRLSKEQSALLEESFKDHSTLNPKQKNALAKELNLRPRQVEVWFQNRRARTKLKQTEVDCEMLKRYCENLTEENRRLQKELQELRALKGSPPCASLYMPLPAATLTMCPSCDHAQSSLIRGSFHY